MDDKRKKLYQGLVSEGLYSKSYDEFVDQFTDPEARSKLYGGLVNEGLYSKEYADFEDQFFSDLQKKNPEVSSTDSSNGSQIESPQADAPIAGETSELRFLGRENNQVDQAETVNPLVAPFKSAWNYAKNRLPAAIANAAAAFTATDEETLKWAAMNSITPETIDPNSQYATDENAWAKGKSEEMKDMKKNLIRWGLERNRQSEVDSRGLIRSLDDVHDWVDALNFAGTIMGEAVPQLAGTFLTGGASSLGEATGNIYAEEVMRTADKYGLTPEEVIQNELDEPAVAVAFGAASSVIDKISADAVFGKMTTGSLGQSLRGRLATFGQGIPGGLKAVGSLAGKMTGEGATEVAQGYIEEGGAALGSGTKFDKPLKESRDEFLAGFIGAAPISAATTVSQYNQSRKEAAAAPETTEEVSNQTATTEEVVTPEPTYEEILAAKTKVEKNRRAELGDEVEYEGKSVKVVDETTTDDGVEMITLQDEDGNEVEVSRDEYTTKATQELAGVDPGLVSVVDVIEKQKSSQKPPESLTEAKSYDETNIDNIASDNPDIPFLAPLANAFKAVESIKGVTLHPDDASFAEAVGGIAAGAMKGDQMHINASRINSTTGLHEAVTPIAANIATSNPELLDNFYNQIRESDAYEGLKDFEALYEDDLKKEEVVTEYLARVAAGEIDVTPSTLEQIKAFIQSLLDKIGISVFDVNLNDETDIRFFAGKLAENLRSGGQIDLEGRPVDRNQSTELANEEATTITDEISDQQPPTKFQRVGNVNPDEVLAKDALREANQRGFITSQNRNQVLNTTAQAFNLPRQTVDLLMKRIEEGPRYIKAPSAVRSTKVFQKLSDLHSKYLAGNRGLPSVVQQMTEQRTGSIAALVEAGNNTAKKMNRLIKKHKADVDEVDKLMRGQTTVAASPLPTEIKDLAMRMRADVDALSQAILDEGYIEQNVLGTRDVTATQVKINDLNTMAQQIENDPNATANDRRRMGLYKKKAGELQGKLNEIQQMRYTIEANLGTYLTRAYELFDNKNYTPTEAAYENAVAYVMTDMQVTREEAERHVKQVLKDYKDKSTKKGTSPSQKAKKDNTIFKARKEVPDEFRELFGEYTDPLQAYAETMFRLASFVENARFLNNLRDIGMGSFLFEKGDLAAPDPSLLTKISAENNKALQPLDGLYTYEEVAKALEGGSDIFRGYPLIDWFNAAVNWNKTVGSYQTHARNVIGNIPFMLGNGYFLSVDPKTWGKPTKAIVKAFRAVMTDATGKYGTKDSPINDLLARLKQNGVIGQNLSTNMIQEILNDKNIPERLYKRRYNKRKSLFQKGVNVGRKVVDVLNTAYGAEDDFFKVAAYLIEADQRSQAYFNKPYDQLTEEQQREVDEEAMEIVKNVLPNYSRIGTGIKQLSAFPLVGNFVSFASEAMRVSYNNLNQATAELRSTNPGIRRIGAFRLINQAAYAGAKAAIIKGIGAAIGAQVGYVLHTAPQALLGSNDEEDKEKERAVREFMWEWVKNNDLAVLDIKDGVIRVQDVGATDPHSNFARLKNSIRLLEDDSKIPEVIVEELLLPFFDQSIAMQYLESIKDGTDTYGESLSRPTAPRLEKLQDAAWFTARTVGPTSINSAMKLVEGKGTLLGQMFGNTYEIDILRVFPYKIAEYSSFRDPSARQGIMRKASEVLSSDASQEEKDKWMEQLNTERKAALDKLKVSYDRALLLGTDEQKLRKLVREKLVKDEEQYVIYGGRYKPLTPRDITIYK